MQPVRPVGHRKPLRQRDMGRPFTDGKYSFCREVARACRPGAIAFGRRPWPRPRLRWSLVAIPDAWRGLHGTTAGRLRRISRPADRQCYPVRSAGDVDDRVLRQLFGAERGVDMALFGKAKEGRIQASFWPTARSVLPPQSRLIAATGCRRVTPAGPSCGLSVKTVNVVVARRGLVAADAFARTTGH